MQIFLYWAGTAIEALLLSFALADKIQYIEAGKRKGATG